MPDQRRTVAEFFEVLQPALARIRSVKPDAEPTATLLGTAAFHLAAANFGRRLYARARIASGDELLKHLNEDPTTVETAATVLVTSSCVSAVDLCCGAIARFSGFVVGPLDRDKREWDFGNWRLDRGNRRRLKEVEDKRAELLTIAPSLHRWLTDLEDSKRWLDLDDLRQGVVHKWWRRDITISVPSIGGAVEASRSDPFASYRIDLHLRRAGVVSLDAALPAFYSTAEERWRACVQAFEHVVASS